MTDQLCPGCPGDPNETCCKPELRVQVWMDKQKADMSEQKTEQKTLRDEFAMAALGGAITNCGMPSDNSFRYHLAQQAYQMADAMLDARNQEPRHG